MKDDKTTTYKEKEFKRYTITAALPYANGPLHIGHIAGAYLPADIFVRYLRMKGKDVVFVCGSDEHGAAITVKAKKEGSTPQAIIDKYNDIIKKTFEDFGIGFDIYHRTSSPIHHQTAQEFFTAIHEKGNFEVEESQQYYDDEAKQFLADRYIIGTCPKCGNENAYGDQCERCGSSLSPLELINPRSTLSGAKPILKTTKHWYLPLQKHEAWVKNWIETGLLNGEPQHDPREWKAHVLGQCKSWLDGGLQPRAMTRDLDWGVKVPITDAVGKVLYVWLDAPIGYISATKAWAEATGKDWKPYWQSDDTKLIHFIGKDNIVFHCIIFPIILALKGEYILPNNVPANEFLNLEGNKISTSRNWAVWVHEYLADFPHQRDLLKYVLTSISPENKDSEFTWKDFQTRCNSELADILGNFVNRAMVLTIKNFEGKVPPRGQLTDYDSSTLAKIEEIKNEAEKLINEYKFRDAQFAVMNLARVGNKYLGDTEPWKVIKNDRERAQTILNIALQITANLGVLFLPFLPDTAAAIQAMTNQHINEWDKAGNADLLPEGAQLGEAKILFTKIEDAAIAAQIAKLEESKNANIPVAPIKEAVSFDDFMKLDLRIATITHAEKVAKAKKLLKLTLETGADTRTVISGIAEYYEPENIIGKQVVLLANLAPKEIKGMKSEGMILMAEDKDGRLAFVQPDKTISNGGVVR